MINENECKFATTVYISEYHRGLLLKAGMYQKFSNFVREQIEEHFEKDNISELKKRKENEVSELETQIIIKKKELDELRIKEEKEQIDIKKYEEFTDEEIKFIKALKKPVMSNIDIIDLATEFIRKFTSSSHNALDIIRLFDKN